MLFWTLIFIFLEMDDPYGNDPLDFDVQGLAEVSYIIIDDLSFNITIYLLFTIWKSFHLTPS